MIFEHLNKFKKFAWTKLLLQVRALLLSVKDFELTTVNIFIQKKKLNVRMPLSLCFCSFVNKDQMKEMLR